MKSDAPIPEAWALRALTALEKDTALRQQIEFGMRRVPRRGGACQYIPLSQMPIGTEIWFDANNTRTPGEREPLYAPPDEDEDPRDTRLDPIQEEEDVLRLPEGRYGLRIGETNSVTLIYPDGSEEAVRPLYDLLAPTSCFQATVERPKLKRAHPDDTWTTTFRLTTGMIKAIFIPGTRFNLTLTTSEEIDPFPLMTKAGQSPHDYQISGELDV